jgi:hypothetical protein
MSHKRVCVGKDFVRSRRILLEIADRSARDGKMTLRLAATAPLANPSRACHAVLK